MKRFGAILAIFSGFVIAAGAAVLPAGSGVFAEPDAGAPMIGALPREIDSGDAKVVTSFLEKDHLARRIRFFQMDNLAPGKTLYVTTDVVLEKTPDAPRGLKKYLVVRSPGQTVWVAVNALLLAGLAAAAYRQRQKNYAPLLALSGIIALRNLITGIIVWLGGNIFLLSSDEPDFFIITRDMMKFQLEAIWPRTFGQGLFYLPFAWLTGAQSCFDILAGVSYFNAYVVMPGIIVLFFLIARKLTGSTAVALWTALIYAVIPMFYFHDENWQQNYAMGYFALPAADWCFAYYKSLTWGGFNAMSDVPSTALVLLLIYGSLKLEKKYCHAAMLGALFGLACAFRINNLFYAPVAAYLWLARDKFDWRKSALDALAGGIGFLAVFGWQFYLNNRQFGSAFTFPYVLYDQTADGFRLDMVAKNLPILFGANLWLFLPGFAAIAFLGDRKLQLTLALWIVPTLIFFAGYVHTRDDVTRFVFPVYGATSLGAAAFLVKAWSRRKLGRLLVIESTPQD